MRQRINNIPVIGITIDLPDNNSYSGYPWYAIRRNYADAVIAGGGIPVLLPIAIDYINFYIRMVDGLLITGGDFDIDPSYYGESIKSQAVKLNLKRTEFEIAILREALKINKPVLGICGGMQLINVVMGGLLIQDIVEETGSTIHQQLEQGYIPTHDVYVRKSTKLYQVLQQDVIKVNSSHHQSVKCLGKNVIMSAYASDMIVEAIEVPDYQFCLGVQWHPEYLASQNDMVIFNAFVKAAALKI